MRIVCITLCLLAFVIALPAAAFPHNNDNGFLTYGLDDTTDYVVTEVDWSPQTYIGKRDTVAFDDIKGFFTEHLGAIYSGLETSGMTAAGTASGLYWHWDMDNMRTAMAAAVPVSETAAAFDDYEVISIPAGKALVIDYFGPYEQMMGAHEALDAYIVQHEMGAPSVVVEEYLTDPEKEPDSSKWQTRILYVFAD